MNKAVGSRTISEQMRLEFVDEQGGSSAFVAEFEFDPSDPFAVSILFQGDPAPVRWTFARDLLIEGFYEPTGDGDVHVWPCLSANGTAVVVLELSSPNGQVLLQVDSRELNAFNQRMLRLVPAGYESEHIDFDAELHALLSI